jgi:pyruvate/2-oxoglutarate/acetoin dehydrogenase E1 component
MPEDVRYADAIRQALCDAMDSDPSVLLLGIDIGTGGGVYGITKGLQERFGASRVRDTPIAEAGVAGVAVGAAMAGLRPVMEIMYMDFLSVCLDPIINQAAKLRYMTGGGVTIPLVFRMQTGAGRSGGAQHSQSLEALLAHIPGLKVYCPADARDAYDLLRAAIEDDNPVCFVENRRLYPIPSTDWNRPALPPGVPRVVRSGSALTVVTWGRMLREVLKVIDQHDGPGADADVIDVRTLVPLDPGLILESVRRTGRCLIVHEAVERFGPGGEILARVVESALFDLDGPVRRLGALPTPVPYSPPLENAMLPGPDRIAAALDAVAQG